jgi:hypothetical protein
MPCAPAISKQNANAVDSVIRDTHAHTQDMSTNDDGREVRVETDFTPERKKRVRN